MAISFSEAAFQSCPLPRDRAAPEEETVVGRVDGPKVRTWNERSMSISQRLN